MDEPISPPPPTPDGQPITPYDEALVRRTYKMSGSWPIPALLAEIDRLRAIEAAARNVDSAGKHRDISGYPELAATLAALRAALQAPTSSKPEEKL